MVPVFLKHTDSGAPLLTGQDGSLYNVLKWALPQLGWTVAFDDAADFSAAFRNNPTGGTGFYLKLTDKASLHDAAATEARGEVFMSMIDINTGVDPVYNVQRFLPKSFTADSAAREWLIVGDSLRFHLFISALSIGSSAGFNWITFGDLKTFFPNDTGAFFCPLKPGAGGGIQSAAWGIAGVNRNVGGSLFPFEYPQGIASNFSGLQVGATATLRSYDQGGLGPGNSGAVLAPSTPAARFIVHEGVAPRGEIVGALNPLQVRPHGGGWSIVQGVDNGAQVVDVLYVNQTPYFAESSPNRGSVYIDITSDWSNW